MLEARWARHSGGELLVALVVALLLHALLAALLALSMPWTPKADAQALKTPPKPKEHQVVVTTITERELEQRLKPKPEPPKPEPKPDPEPPKPDPEPPKPPDPTLNRKVVIQETNEQQPTKAEYLSEQANATLEQTRAEQTTMKDVLPGKPAPEPPDDAGQPDPDPVRDTRDEDAARATQRPQEIAMSVPTPKPSRELSPPQAKAPPQDKAPPDSSKEPLKESDDGPMVYKDLRKNKDELVKVDPDATDSPLVRKPDPTARPQRGRPDPNTIFNAPQVADYERAFGQKDDAPTTEQPQNKRRRMFSNIKRRQQNLKASLENMIPEIQPGNHTSVNAHPAVYAGYIASLHRKIHARWADDFLMALDTSYPRDHPMQDPKLGVTLEFVIQAKSGKFEAVNIVRSSGLLMFDAEAIDTAWAIGDRPNPPPQIISPNGKIYIHWTFWRDGRQCGVFGASILLLTEDGSRVKQSAQSVPGG